MNDTVTKTNPLSNHEEHEKLVLDLKQDIQAALAKAKQWEGSYIKIEQNLAETERRLRQSEEDKEALKRENLRQRKIELATKETKNKNDTLTLFEQAFKAKMEVTK